MLTHDTKKALVQTTAGQIDLCKFLFEQGFQYVLFRELQSDRIEGEYGVYRQSTGANAFMVASDVLNAFKKRLTKFAVSHLQSLEFTTDSPKHVCRGMEYRDAAAIEQCADKKLSQEEELSCAFVAGWLELKCKDLEIPEDEDLVSGDALDFINEVSRDYLTIPHESVFDLVKSGLQFINHSKTDACCRKKLSTVLTTICNYSGYPISKNLITRLSNVLLHGLHKLEKDLQTNQNLYQTSIKKARLAN